jgi:hypothetical protein
LEGFTKKLTIFYAISRPGLLEAEGCSSARPFVCWPAFNGDKSEIKSTKKVTNPKMNWHTNAGLGRPLERAQCKIVYGVANLTGVNSLFKRGAGF